MRVKAPTTLVRRMSTEQIIHAEGKGRIYLPVSSSNASSSTLQENGSKKVAPKNAFLNPVQEFNRDLSIVAIRTWSEMFANEKLQSMKVKQQRRAAKAKSNADDAANGETEERSSKRRKGEDGEPIQQQEEGSRPLPNLHKFTVFEGLAATGLRSIRYALELPLIKSVTLP